MSHILLFLGCFQTWNVTDDCNAIERFLDQDGDGFGTQSLIECTGAHPSSFSAEQGGDCDDADDQIHPEADEICDGIDNNCSGDVDQNPVSGPTWYSDVDGDGFGDPETGSMDCTQPSGKVSDSSDCDDTKVEVYPGALEICGDAVLNDCNGSGECRLSGSERLYRWDLEIEEVYAIGLGSTLNTGDLSGDGVADLSASTGPSANLGMVSVAFDLPNTPSQTLYYHESSYSGFGTHDIGDMSGDGQADLAVAADELGKAYLFEGPLDPLDQYVSQGEALATLSFTDQGAGETRILILEDMYGEGTPQMALTEPSKQRLTVFNGVWTDDEYDEQDSPRLYSNENNFGLALLASDTDGDGLPELSVLNQNVAHIVNTAEISDGALLDDCSSNMQADDRFQDMSPAGDASGSGAQAIWVSTPDNEIGLWRGESNWDDLPVRLSLGKDYELQGPVSGGQDMDGDGNMDLAFSVIDVNEENGVCLSYGPFDQGVLSPDYCGNQKGSSEVGIDVLLTPDLNGDDVPDLATGDPSENSGRGAYYLLYGQGL